ncbi:MAG: hypothetical protein ACRDNG_04005 [Gaiellaceae bacterium]
MRTRVVGLAALAAVALAAGCGGGGDGGGGGERLTAEEFVQQADAICEDTNQQLDELNEPENVDDLAALAAEAVSINEQSVDALRELNPPEELQGQFDRALELLDQQNALGRELVTAAEDGDQAKIQEIVAQGEPLQTEARGIAGELGLTKCGAEDAG